MSVWFDTTGYHDHPGGVDDLADFASQNTRRGHGHDLFPPDRHVPHTNTHGCNNFPTPNDQVQHF